MKKLVRSFYLITILSLLSVSLFSQEFDFRNTTYYYRLPNDSLVSTGLNLGQFNFSSANRLNDSLFHDGIYFPASDCFGHNLWIRLRHVADDPNGTSVGINISSTASNPCNSNIMIGGWAGFLYDFEIHKDVELTNDRSYFLGALYPTSITVASLETLSGECGNSEWLSFAIKNSGSTGWDLNSTRFTGSNPNSNPAFSDTMAIYTTGTCYPPDGFSYDFPFGADSISAINGNQSGFSEFKMSAGDVSHFQYGYEYIGQGGGYQGMSMAFGAPPTFQVTAVDVTCKDGIDGEINVEISGGIGPFTYQWNNGTISGSSLTSLPFGTYNLVVTDQNGCGSVDTTVTINEPVNVSVFLDSIRVRNVTCFKGNDGSLQVFANGNATLTYLWGNGTSDSQIAGLSAGNYSVTISDESSCLYVQQAITEPAPSIDVSLNVTETKISSNETGATYQWINCNGNIPIPDSTYSTFSPSEFGDYKVAISKNGCSDTSICANVATIGLPKNETESAIRVFPNPSNGNILLEFDKVYPSIQVTVVDLSGKVVYRENSSNQSNFKLALNQVAGVYFLSVNLGEKRSVQKIFIH